MFSPIFPQIVNKLGIITDPVKAKQNEELLANISKSSLNYITLDVVITMVDLSKKRSVQLLDKYNKLKEFYTDLDGILSELKKFFTFLLFQLITIFLLLF